MRYSVLLHSVNDHAYGHDKNDENDLQNRLESIKKNGLKHFAHTVHRTAFFQFAKDFEQLFEKVSKYSYNRSPDYTGFNVVVAIPDFEFSEGKAINTLVQHKNDKWQEGCPKVTGSGEDVECLYNKLVGDITPPEFILGITRYKNGKVINFQRNPNHFSLLQKEKQNEFLETSGISENIRIRNKLDEIHIRRNDGFECIEKITGISQDDEKKYVCITENTLTDLVNNLSVLSQKDKDSLRGL